MSIEEADLNTKQQQRRPRRWIGGFKASQIRHRLFLALGSRVRLSLKARIIWALVIFFIAFSVRALTAVDVAPLTQTSSQWARTMSLGFHYEALGALKGNGVLIREEWDPTNTSLLIHSPG